jgi:hypothetical protein
MKIKVLFTLSLSLISVIAFSQTFNLYSAPSEKSEVVAKIDTDESNGYFRFYTDKKGEWTKCANRVNGIVGYLNLKKIYQKKADDLRKKLQKNIDNNLEYYKVQIQELKQDKKKIANASYQELVHVTNIIMY